MIPRAFVAGDACHTHSPKGGWGLNTSLPDTFNLGWKLVSVIQGKCQPKLLQTYESERRKVALQLIDADRQLSALVATRPTSSKDGSQSDTNTADIEKFMARQNGFVSGTSIEYDPSYICVNGEHQGLASGLKIGQRFHSAEAIRVADGDRQHLGHLNKADGRWRLFIFGNKQDPTNASSDVYQLVDYLAAPNSFVHKYTPKGADIDALFDVYAVFQQADLSLSLIHI